MAAQGFKLILPDYRYKTPSFNGIIENEICPVYFARTNGQPNPNPEEVADFKWLAWPEYVKQLEADQTDEFSWWSKDQLKQLKDQLK
jgi:isopentenyl-diphosphate delta-isomerase